MIYKRVPKSVVRGTQSLYMSKFTQEILLNIPKKERFLNVVKR